MDIKKFLMARIAEDEAAARAALEDIPGHGDSYQRAFDLMATGGLASRTRAGAPQRLLAECAAKRAMIGFAEAAGAVESTLEDIDYGWESSEFRMLQVIASVYAWHPEYQAGWTS